MHVSKLDKTINEELAIIEQLVSGLTKAAESAFPNKTVSVNAGTLRKNRPRSRSSNRSGGPECCRSRRACAAYCGRTLRRAGDVCMLFDLRTIGVSKHVFRSTFVPELKKDIDQEHAKGAKTVAPTLTAPLTDAPESRLPNSCMGAFQKCSLAYHRPIRSLPHPAPGLLRGSASVSPWGFCGRTQVPERRFASERMCPNGFKNIAARAIIDKCVYAP